MTIEIVRHGLTLLQAQRRYQGRTDVSLSREGRAMLMPSGETPDMLAVSPLQRARQTAEILYPGCEQRIIPDFAEIDFGVFEGRNFAEMEHDPDYRSWVDGGCTGTCPGGESKEAFCARVTGAFSRLVDEALAGNVPRLVIVAHGGTQMAVMECFCEERRPYFSWQLPGGCGYLLGTDAWNRKTLRLLGTMDHNRR